MENPILGQLEELTLL